MPSPCPHRPPRAAPTYRPALASRLFVEVTDSAAPFSAAGLAAAILTAEPPPLATTLGPHVPPALEHLVRTCLAKNPEDRWQTAHDLLIQLRWVAEQGPTAGDPGASGATVKTTSWPVKAALALGLLLTASAAWPAYQYFRGPAPKDAFQFRVPVVGLIAAAMSYYPTRRAVRRFQTRRRLAMI